MAYFPLFVDLKNKKIVVAGGGAVATAKVKRMLAFEPEIHIIAPIISEGLSELSQKVPKLTCKLAEISEDDLEGAFLAVAATNDRSVNHRVAGWCKEKGVIVNVADVPVEGTVAFGAFFVDEDNDITVSVSTGGSSPKKAVEIRNEIENKYF